jgi:hypothetical protein
MAYPYTVGQYNLQNYDGAGGFTHTWADWTTATAGCTATPISQATFAAECPDVNLPPNHSGTILKVVVNNSGGGSTLACTVNKTVTGYLNIAGIKNMIMRFHVPYTSLDALNGFRLQCRGTGSASTDSVQSQSWQGEKNASRVAGFQITQEPFALAFCPNYDMFVLGTNQANMVWPGFAGTENALEEEHWKAYWGGQSRAGAGTSWSKAKLSSCRIQMQVIANANSVCTFYFFDLLKDVVSTQKPKLVCRWDDGSESQYNHLFPVVKKYGVPSVISCPLNDQVGFSEDATFTNGSSDIAISNLTYFTVNSRVILQTTGALPSGFELEKTYYVVYSSGGIIRLSATLGGGAITATSAGSGTHIANNPAAGAMSAANAREMRESGVEFIIHSDGGAGGLVSEGLNAATTRLRNHINGYDTVFGDAGDKRGKKCIVYPGNDFYSQFNEFPGDNRPDLRVQDLAYQLGVRAACATNGNFAWFGETVELNPMQGGGLVVLGGADTQYANVTDAGWYGVDSAAKLQWLVEFLNESGAMGAVLMGHIVQNAVPVTFTNGSATLSGGADAPSVSTSLYANGGEKVVFAGSPPTPFVAGTTYYLTSYGVPSANSFTVAATRGGANISATANGSATFTMEGGLTIPKAKVDNIYAEVHARRVAGDVIPTVFTDFASGLGIEEIGVSGGGSSSGGLLQPILGSILG